MISTQTAIKRKIVSHQLTPGSAWDQTNVGDIERWLSLGAGGFLAIEGMARRDLPGLVLTALGGYLCYRGLSGSCPVYRALNIRTARHSPTAAVAAGRGVKVTRATTINRPAEELYQHWRNLENLPIFMTHLLCVECRGNRSHWVARGPDGINAEWDAEIINEEENRLLAWRSLEGSEVSTAGSVHFTPLSHGRGTEVRVVLKYDPPGGALGSWLASAFGQDPGQQIREDLRHFKQLMEAGERPTAARARS